MASKQLRSKRQRVSPAKQKQERQAAARLKKLKKQPGGPPPKAPPGTQSQKICLFGTLTNGRAYEEQFLEVYAGEQSPTATKGYAEWVEVARPKRVSLTVLKGYEPMTLTVPLRFDASVDAQMMPDVEREIQKLEWMAGRGILFRGGNRKVGHPGQGDSPLIRIYSTNPTGRPIPLVPVQFQSNNLYWVISDLTFDTNPLRSAGGARIRQDVTVTALQHVSAPGHSFDSPETRAEARNTLKGKVKIVTTTKTLNDVQKIAAQIAHNPRPEAVKKILAANKNNRAIGNNPYKPLRSGTRVRVPWEVILAP